MRLVEVEGVGGWVSRISWDDGIGMPVVWSGNADVGVLVGLGKYGSTKTTCSGRDRAFGAIGILVELLTLLL